MNGKSRGPASLALPASVTAFTRLALVTGDSTYAWTRLPEQHRHFREPAAATADHRCHGVGSSAPGPRGPLADSQRHYRNWRQFGTGFLTGGPFWCRDDLSEANGQTHTRLGVIRGLHVRPGSPWRRVPLYAAATRSRAAER